MGATALSGCAQGGGATSDPNTSAGAAAQDCSNVQQAARWELDRRLGQLLMGAIYADAGETAIRAAVKQVAKGNIGGVNVLGDSSYSYSNNELAQAVDAGGQVPPFLAVDEEGGRVQRIETRSDSSRRHASWPGHDDARTGAARRPRRSARR